MLQQAADVPAGAIAQPRVTLLVVNKVGSPFFQIDWWQCIPLPLSPKIGLGMKVAI